MRWGRNSDCTESMGLHALDASRERQAHGESTKQCRSSRSVRTESAPGEGPASAARSMDLGTSSLGVSPTFSSPSSISTRLRFRTSLGTPAAGFTRPTTSILSASLCSSPSLPFLDSLMGRPSSSSAPTSRSSTVAAALGSALRWSLHSLGSVAGSSSSTSAGSTSRWWEGGTRGEEGLSGEGSEDRCRTAEAVPEQAEERVCRCRGDEEGEEAALTAAAVSEEAAAGGGVPCPWLLAMLSTALSTSWRVSGEHSRCTRLLGIPALAVASSSSARGVLPASGSRNLGSGEGAPATAESSSVRHVRGGIDEPAA
jgi:hypothetical protein